jgi:hypothetical protein
MLQRDDHDRPMTMDYLLLGLREAQLPLLAFLLLGGSAAKFVRVIRVGTVDAGLGPTALFPMPLRRRVAVSISAVELGCGAALVVTAVGVGQGAPATAARLATSLLFIVATLALLELRSSRPTTGCGCFGDLSIAPVSGRTLARSALLAGAGMVTIGLPQLQTPPSAADAVLVLAALAVELAVIAALSPEVSEALVRLGYSEACELRRLPAGRTLAALRKSAQWRRRAGVITADTPVDMWRELCWRYVVFPARAHGREAEAVFAVYLRPHRPMVHAALVDAETGTVLDWPAAPQRQRTRRFPGRAPQPARWPAGGRVPAPGLAAPGGRVPAPGLAAPGLAGPVLAGPVLVGPALAGPALAGPAFGSSSVVGPVLVGPALATSGSGRSASTLTAPALSGPILVGAQAVSTSGRSAVF